jgi:unsaturated chondroitin disaccharide hydrolase
METIYRQILEQTLVRYAAGVDAVIRTLPAHQDDRYLNLNPRNGTWFYGGLDWWAGFLCGKVWMLYDYTGEDRYKEAGLDLVRRCSAIAQEKSVDTGFAIYYSAALGYELTGNEELKRIALAGAESLAACFDPKAKVVMMWPEPPKGPLVFPYNRFCPRETLIDAGATLSLLWWAGSHKGRYREVATEHHYNQLSYGMVRPDGSAHHALSFDDDSRPVRLHTHQGYRDDTQWARGQAWGMISFTMAAGATGDPSFYDVAERAADWFISHLPSDLVPYYDFFEPAIPHVPRDSCAAAIAICAMTQMARRNETLANRYQPYIERLTAELVKNYLTPCGLLLHGSWGNDGLNPPKESVMPYGNYYFMEAVYRQLRPDRAIWGIPQVRPA